MGGCGNADDKEKAVTGNADDPNSGTAPGSRRSGFLKLGGGEFALPYTVICGRESGQNGSDHCGCSCR